MAEKVQGSIYEYFFEGGPVVEINSPRVQFTGKKASWDSCVLKFGDGEVRDVDITSSKKKIEEGLKGKNIVNHGGISNASSMYRQFPGAETLILRELEKAMEKEQTLPNVFDYVFCTQQSIRESMEKNFKEAHGYNLSNFLDMPIFEVQQISKTEKSKSLGVKPLNWKLVDVSTRGGGKEGQTEIALYSQRPPFTRGYDAGFVYIGESLWDPTKKEITNVGGKGQTTTAQDFGVSGIDTLQMGGKEYVIEGVGNLTEYGKNAIDEMRENGYKGVQIITQTWIDEISVDRKPKGIPRQIAPVRKTFIE